jgi:hypothetical protein
MELGGAVIVLIVGLLVAMGTLGLGPGQIGLVLSCE